MEQVPGLEPDLGLQWWSLGTVVLMVLMAVAVFVAWRFWRDTYRWDFVIPVLRETGWFGMPVVVAVTFAGISMQDQPPPWAGDQRTSIASTRKPVNQPPVAPSSQVAIPVGSQTTTPADLTACPAWVNQPSSDKGISGRTVLSSGQYATREEAESELMSKTSDMVIQRIRPEDSLGNWTGSWRPAEQDIRRYAVKQEYTEVAETDFGSFQHPMYRVWWQVDLSPAARAGFLPAWHRETVTTRIRLVGIVATSIALAASLIRIYFRLDALTLGRYRLALKGLTGGCAAAWFLLVRCVSEGRFW